MSAVDVTDLDSQFTTLQNKWVRSGSKGWADDLISAGTVTNYFQRVYDTGTVGWCYYTKSIIDATPDAVDTTPNWSGIISDHSIIKIITS